MVALRDTVLTENSERMQKLLDGDADALMQIVTECGLSILPDEETLPTGALGASDATRRQATAGKLAEQVRRLGDLYLDKLAEGGAIRVVQSEQEFYNELEAVASE